MGQDKAALLLAGQTLLLRAVVTLRAVAELQDVAGQVAVSVLGERAELSGADRAVADRYPGCGPLGGMEAALKDLESSGDADWAFFMPVDMPFLSSKLIDGLLREWIPAAASRARICHVAVSGRPLPLVSLVHRSVHPYMVEALAAGHFRVTRVLQSASESMAMKHGGDLSSCLHVTQAEDEVFASPNQVWAATSEREDLKRLWFSNLNTREQFANAETFIASLG